MRCFELLLRYRTGSCDIYFIHALFASIGVCSFIVFHPSYQTTGNASLPFYPKPRWTVDAPPPPPNEARLDPPSSRTICRIWMRISTSNRNGEMPRPQQRQQHQLTLSQVADKLRVGGGVKQLKATVRKVEGVGGSQVEEITFVFERLCVCMFVPFDSPCQSSHLAVHIFESRLCERESETRADKQTER